MGLNGFSFLLSWTYQSQPFFSQYSIASSLVENWTFKFDSGSPLHVKEYIFNRVKDTINYLRRTPSHQRVFPAFLSIKIHFPVSNIVSTTLHTIFRRFINSNLTGLDLFIWDTTYQRQFSLKST